MTLVSFYTSYPYIVCVCRRGSFLKYNLQVVNISECISKDNYIWTIQN
jgi:hypothetical protein